MQDAIVGIEYAYRIHSITDVVCLKQIWLKVSIWVSIGDFHYDSVCNIFAAYNLLTKNKRQGH